jgi:hypothetical protein
MYVVWIERFTQLQGIDPVLHPVISKEYFRRKQNGLLNIKYSEIPI